MSTYRARAVDFVIDEFLTQLPALMIVGPRAAGKTTTAARHSKTVVRLDRDADAEAFRADPDAALRGLEEPVLLDEWQAVPEVLGAVKRAVDVGAHPGRFLLTGSVRADLDAQTWPGTGRVVRVDMRGLTVSEILGAATVPFVDRVLAGTELLPPRETPDVVGYLELALRGRFPEPVFALEGKIRELWFESYLDQVVTRDAALLPHAPRDPERLRRYLRAYALNSGGLATDKTIYDAANINRKTAIAYEQLLANLLIAETVPAWTSNRLKRLVLSAKRYVTDTALLAAAIDVVDSQTIFRDPDLLGRVIDTFVTGQLSAERTWARNRYRLHHLRQESGTREVDLIIEVAADRVIGIEIKASSAPRSEDARHLLWLADELGGRFLRGVVLHTGPRTYELGPNIVAAPISTLWSGG